MRVAISSPGTVANRQEKSTNCMFRSMAILPGSLLRARLTLSLAVRGQSGKGRVTPVFDSDMIPSV